MNRNIDKMSAFEDAMRDMANFAANLNLKRVRAEIITPDSPPDVIEYWALKAESNLQDPVYIRSMEEEEEIYDKRWLDYEEARSMARYETDQECSWREFNNEKL
jgi:hypothetical protein